MLDGFTDPSDFKYCSYKMNLKYPGVSTGCRISTQGVTPLLQLPRGEKLLKLQIQPIHLCSVFPALGISYTICT